MKKPALKSFDVIANGQVIWTAQGRDSFEAWAEVEANADWLIAEAGVNNIMGLNLQEA